MASPATVNFEIASKAPVILTAIAIEKAKQFISEKTPVPAGLRIGVAGGGCSGFTYSMHFENVAGEMDKIYGFDGLAVFIDATSAMYLQGCIVDYEDTPDGAGFIFENPNQKTTCGCGSSCSA
jgi:iron-sulfur cluster assembly accessory protein